MLSLNEIQRFTDYKDLLKSRRLTMSQKRLLHALCRQPTAQLFATDYMTKHGLTADGVRSALSKLDNYGLTKQDQDKIWQLANPGMQAWLHAVLTSSNHEKIAELRFGEWGGSASKPDC